jgi:hypothetical protein
MKQKDVERQAKIIAARMCFYDLSGDDTRALRRYNAVGRTNMSTERPAWAQYLWAPLENGSTDEIEHVMEGLYLDIITRFGETP